MRYDELVKYSCRVILQLFVDSVNDEVVSITRHNPVSHVSVVTIARTAFSFPSNPLDGSGVPSVTIPGM